MLEFIAFLVFTVYTVGLTFITLFCLMQFNLLYHYIKGKKKEPKSKAAQSNQEGVLQDWPLVTIQLPVYNEMYVVERLIECIMRFDYPKELLEIQVLDDSTDETVGIIAEKVASYQLQGFRIEHLHRDNRQGFKAGALKEAMQKAGGQFIAIFDADFLPDPSFLKKTLPHFNTPEIGVVQTRWEHLNEGYSLITKLQALQLNVHFTVEQLGRMYGNLFLQFNGTAGVWRRRTIDDAGGWEADTLTEDLDLSIRAQLKGWKILYLEEVGSPAELPAEMNSFKSQQFRWMKGGAETARKILPAVWKSKIGMWKKLQATFHLLGSTTFLFVFIIGVFSVPMMYFAMYFESVGLGRNWFAVFLVGWLSIFGVYYVGNVKAAIHKGQPFLKLFFKFLLLFPLFLALSMGLSLHNTIAVLQGYLGKKSAFVRTPKFNIQSTKDSLSNKKYAAYSLNWTTVGEGLLAVFFLGSIIVGLQSHNNMFLLFHIMLCFGYGAIFYLSVKDWRGWQRKI